MSPSQIRRSLSLPVVVLVHPLLEDRIDMFLQSKESFIMLKVKEVVSQVLTPIKEVFQKEIYRLQNELHSPCVRGMWVKDLQSSEIG